MNAIEVKELTKAYSKFKLDHISFDLPTGTIVGLVGENGAGKSTTIELIMNSIKKDFGSVEVLGVSSEDQAFTQVKQQIGVVLDEAYFPETITAKAVDKIMSKTYSKWNTEVYCGYIKRFGLSLNQPFKAYSRGMKMKLSIAVALSHEAKLLILDEATSGLDPMSREELLDIFNEFTRDESHSILISSHIVSDLEQLCDYIAFIHKGKIQLYEGKDELLEKYAIVNVSDEELETIAQEAIISAKPMPYTNKVLVYRDKIADIYQIEHSTLEEIIIFFAKEKESYESITN